MGLPRPKPIFTVDQYLAYERESEERHEFFDGEILAMAGESWQHGEISGNFFAAVKQQIKGKLCRAQTKDTKVRSGPSPSGANKTRGLYSYPDIVVVCGEPEFHDAERDIVTNPKVIIEVTSPTTESFDRGEKWDRYQTWNPSLSDYLLVSQDKPMVEHYSRQTNGQWTFQRYSDLKDEVVINSIECRITLAEIYDQISF